MEYRGGTYISQVEAPDVVNALRAWSQQLDPSEIAEFGPAHKRKLIQNIESDIENNELPTPVQGTVNVWCAAATCRNSLMLIDIIQTER